MWPSQPPKGCMELQNWFWMLALPDCYLPAAVEGVPCSRAPIVVWTVPLLHTEGPTLLAAELLGHTVSGITDLTDQHSQMITSSCLQMR